MNPKTKWEIIALVIGAVVGIAKLIWDMIQDYAKRWARSMSDDDDTEAAEAQRDLKQDRMIFEDLRERVNRQDEKIQKLRSDLQEWKDQFYELHTSSQEVKFRNRLLQRSNKKLQKAIVVLRKYLDKVAERLSEYEDIDPPPHITNEALAMGGINDIDDELLDKIGDPNVDTPLEEIFNPDDVPSDDELNFPDTPKPN